MTVEHRLLAILAEAATAAMIERVAVLYSCAFTYFDWVQFFWQALLEPQARSLAAASASGHRDPARRLRPVAFEVNVEFST